ncbi:hypothetical protein CDD83_1416 [Cordyceps sp. RAO-2017]|nr:hypothetical protein CDD83_1416 [Cordyceps sp. RAO-2017]
MVLPGQLAAAAVAGLGCVLNIQKSHIYDSGAGCCSYDFAVVQRDSNMTITDIRCGDTRTGETIEGVKYCTTQDSIFRLDCDQTGVRLAMEEFPQPARCGSAKTASAPGERPKDKTGCYSGRAYVNSEECCSVDYVVADGSGGFRCGDTAGHLGPDNAVYGILKNVPQCRGTIDPSWCPKGIYTSVRALDAGDQCAGTGCCELGWARDGYGVCQRQQYSHRRHWYRLPAEYWAERKRQGCPLPKPDPKCCPNRKHFINGNKVCSEFNSRGIKPEVQDFRTWRYEKDGCVDYVDGLE